MATARSASSATSALMSLVETTACRRPTNTRKPDVVALGALGFLDRALAHLDGERHRTHGHRVGGVGAGAARRRYQAFGEIGECGLIEEGRHCRDLDAYVRSSSIE